VTDGVALGLRGLTKRFDSVTVVDAVDLAVPAGSFFGLVGPNGAGKTTTLNMAVGLLRPDAGRAWVLGHDVWADPQGVKRLLGVLPDGGRMFDRLTAAELLEYVGLLRGMDPALTARRGAELLDVLDLATAGRTLVVDYSTGMRKKIGLACALLHAPRLLVLDEPFEGVDPISAAGIRDILRRYVDGGGTVILSSHVMAVVEQLCTHVAILARGRVLVSGEVADVRAGRSLEDRFVELVGGRTATGVELAWL
jgi:ABC-2 type transport system ATP-binding protein